MTEREQASLSLRINLANGGRFGPGKAALLRAIESEGSIRAGAGKLSMSYPRALKLIDEMNADFREPLVTSTTGGADRGGSALSETGKAVLASFDAIWEEASQATLALLDELTGLQSPD